jgi:probable rRNA maturation factor
VQVQFALPRRGVPAAAALRKWALAARPEPTEVTLRVVAAREGRRLNRTFRRIDRATNVLSFPYGRWQGDVVLCHPVIVREARVQRKTLAAHYAHLVVHAMLHLRGYGHKRNKQASRMEKAEIRVLRRFGFGNPYELK